MYVQHYIAWCKLVYLFKPVILEMYACELANIIIAKLLLFVHIVYFD